MDGRKRIGPRWRAGKVGADGASPSSWFSKGAAAPCWRDDLRVVRDFGVVAGA